MKGGKDTFLRHTHPSPQETCSTNRAGRPKQRSPPESSPKWEHTSREDAQTCVRRAVTGTLTMSDAAFTLSTAPIWSAQGGQCPVLPTSHTNSARTTLGNLRALLGQLHEHDVAEARLGVVRNRHRPDLRCVVVHDRLVVLGVLLRCSARGATRHAGQRPR